jgi:hypothetical protein
MSYSTLILFTHIAQHTKSMGLLIDVPFYSYTFYTHNATYKKHGAPDQNIIVLFIHSNHRRMKSMGHIYIYISSNTSQVFRKTILIEVYKITIFYLQNAQKVFHQDLSAKTTLIVLILTIEKLYWDMKC